MIEGVGAIVNLPPEHCRHPWQVFLCPDSFAAGQAKLPFDNTSFSCRIKNVRQCLCLASLTSSIVSQDAMHILRYSGKQVRQECVYPVCPIAVFKRLVQTCIGT